MWIFLGPIIIMFVYMVRKKGPIMDISSKDFSYRLYGLESQFVQYLREVTLARRINSVNPFYYPLQIDI